MENSFISTGKDMGSNHVEAHHNQHQYLQKGEPLIETLTANSEKEKSTDLALKMAQNTGVRTPEEWVKYNSKLRKSRRKKSYIDYFLSTTANWTKSKQRALDNNKNSKTTRTRIAQELHATIENLGLPIDGSLYYISNVSEYEKRSKDGLEKYRSFEAATFRKFFKSPTFKSLNPQCFRAEIHYDENGAMHLQTQDVWFHMDKRGRISYAKRAMIKQTLIKWYGGEEQLQNRLDVLSEFDNSTEKKIGNKRADSAFYDFVSKWPYSGVDDKEKGVKSDGTKHKYKHSKAERDTRLVELWRIEQMHQLGEIATQTAKEMGIDYQVSDKYETDGIHRNAADYVKHKQDQQKNIKTTAKLIKSTEITLKAQQALSNAYTELTGKSEEELSPLEMAKALKKAAKNFSKKASDNQNKVAKQKEQLQQQKQQLMAQRQQLQLVKQQRENEQNEIHKLQKQKKDLENKLRILKKRLRSAGAIISSWIKNHWDSVEGAFQRYAQQEQQAQSERVFGGSSGTGDAYTAQKYHQKAKAELLSGLDKVELAEQEKLGIKFEVNNKISVTPNSEKEKELDH